MSNKPETEPVQIEGFPRVENVLCVIDIVHADLPQEYTEFIDQPDCVAYNDNGHLGEDIYSAFAIDDAIDELNPPLIVNDTHEKIKMLLDANDAGYFRMVY